MQIGTQLRRIRQTHKQTLAEVGAATDISISYLSRIERSLTEPTLGTLNKLSTHFDVPVSRFFDESIESRRAAPIHRTSFHEFVDKMNGRVDGAMEDLLVRLDAQANKPAKSVDDWLQYYYVIAAVTSKA